MLTTQYCGKTCISGTIEVLSPNLHDLFEAIEMVIPQCEALRVYHEQFGRVG